MNLPETAGGWGVLASGAMAGSNRQGGGGERGGAISAAPQVTQLQKCCWRARRLAGWPFWRSFENDTVSSVRLNKGQGQVPRLAVLHTRGAKRGGGG